MGEKRCLAYVLIQLESIWNEGNEGNQKWEQRSRNPRKSAQLPYAAYFLQSGVSPRRASFRRLQRWYALRFPYASILASALLCFVLFLFIFSLSSLQICVCLVSIKSAFLFRLGFWELMWTLRIACVFFFPLVFGIRLLNLDFTKAGLCFCSVVECRVFLSLEWLANLECCRKTDGGQCHR